MMWCCYLLLCRDKTFYIGITNDLLKRIETHNAGKGAKYTKGRTPVKLVKSFECRSKSEALKLEAAWKKVPRAEKMKFEPKVA